MMPSTLVPQEVPLPGGFRTPGGAHPGRDRFPEGFSLLEIMVVVAVLALAAAIVVPNMLAWRTSLRLGSAVGELRTDLLSAKTLAAKENTTVTVQFYPSTGSYSIKHTNLDGNPVVVKTAFLPPGVSIDQGDPEYSMGGSKTSFTSRGGADSGTMVLTNSDGKKRKITISSLGKITLKD